MRRIACERGLVHSGHRRQCWPLLLGIASACGASTCTNDEDTGNDKQDSEPKRRVQKDDMGFDKCQYDLWWATPHRDSHVVVVDVAR